MKKTFENKPLLISVCLMLFFKILCIFLIDINLDFKAFSSGLLFSFSLIIGLSDIHVWLARVLFGILVLAALSFMAFLVMLAVNRKGASVAITGLIVFCILDALATLPLLVTLSTYFASFLFDLALIILLVLLRRSRSDAPTVTNIDPTQA